MPGRYRSSGSLYIMAREGGGGLSIRLVYLKPIQMLSRTLGFPFRVIGFRFTHAVFLTRTSATTLVAMDLTFQSLFGLSQSALARLSIISCYKLCTYELGTGTLEPSERDKIRSAFENEVSRFNKLVPSSI